ncbi:8-oxoguanine deaminase [Parafrankia sp. BMG5.11]|uniref:8-oxoguanine deaminase n=1 Tax=Parafrankia sp. BMG5.11 TaxID=222540 RepID=UPI00359F1922
MTASGSVTSSPGGPARPSGTAAAGDATAGQRPDHLPVDLLVIGAELVATVDADRREIPGGWVAITDGLVSSLGGPAETPPTATRTLRADGCLITPGLVNTHHHIYQNLTRSFAPALGGTLFTWLTTLYPLWSRLDEEAVHTSAYVGLTELALGGCTTSTDHLYVHPRGGGDLISAEIAAARTLGMRFHPTRGSMSLSVKDGGLPPDSVVQDADEILADSARLVAQHHDPSHGAMVRIALAPCSPFSVSPELMRATAELAESLDVRLHTHLAEDPEEDDYCLAVFGRRPIDQFAEVGWGGDRAWVAHCICPNDEEVEQLGRWGTGVAHCPSSNMILGGGLAPVAELRSAGAPVGLGCDGSSSADSASLWLEARTAMLLGRLRHGAAAMSARDALEIATRGGAGCLGRTGEIGELSVGSVGDLVVWPLDGVAYAGALSDPIDAWLRCGPTAARHTIVAGRLVVENGVPVHPDLDEMLVRHRRIAGGIQAAFDDAGIDPTVPINTGGDSVGAAKSH